MKKKIDAEAFIVKFAADLETKMNAIQNGKDLFELIKFYEKIGNSIPYKESIPERVFIANVAHFNVVDGLDYSMFHAIKSKTPNFDLVPKEDFENMFELFWKKYYIENQFALNKLQTGIYYGEETEKLYEKKALLWDQIVKERESLPEKIAERQKLRKVQSGRVGKAKTNQINLKNMGLIKKQLQDLVVSEKNEKKIIGPKARNHLHFTDPAMEALSAQATTLNLTNPQQQPAQLALPGNQSGPNELPN